uniref:GPCR5 n=1 Tax=Tripedalia cystophora TaxID=6141 RepID=A0A4D5XX61_TRICY|nr:GPCR5 [Tripedalia cystophora]
MINSTGHSNTTVGPNATAPTPNDWPYVPIDPKQGVILMLITIPGVLGNIVAFATTVKLLSTRVIAANYLVLALTLTDFYGILLCTLPTHLCYVYLRWVGGHAMCQFQGFSAMFASLASGCLATAMAVDRLLAITKPFQYKKLVNPKRAIYSAATIWVFSFVLSAIPIGGIGRFKRNLTGTFCTIDWFAETVSNIVFAAFYAFLGIILVFVIVYCNVKVIIGLRNIKRKRETELTSGTLRYDGGKKITSSADVLERQLARSVCVISVLFLICWLPFMFRIVCNLGGWWKNPWVDVQVSRLLLFNFVLDPFLYTFSRKQCRDIMFDWFCCCFRNLRVKKGLSLKALAARRKETFSEHSTKMQSSTLEGGVSTESSEDSRL